MRFLVLLVLIFGLQSFAHASERACRQVTVLRALAVVDRDNLKQGEIKDINQLFRLVCRNINPQSDIYYPNGIKAYSTKAGDWYFPSDKFALLASGRGDVLYPNEVIAYSKKAVDWFYPSNKLAFLDDALLPGLKHPLYYPNGLKAFSEKAVDWFYPSNKKAFLHKALNPREGADMFYPNGVKAYSVKASDWHYPDDTFAFEDDRPTLSTLRELSGAQPVRMDFGKMHMLRIMFVLNRIDRQFRK